jgi:hypothetical protein
MSKLGKYLLEYQESDEWSKVGRGKPLTKDQAYEIIESKCKKTYKAALDGYKIWRVTSSEKGDYTFVDTKDTKPRMSLNTANYYTLIINNDPSWSAFPKRNVIASTEPRNPYPGTYVLLPYDGTKIGVCLSYDIWMSFHTIPAFDVAEFNRNINGLLRIGSGLGGMAKIDSIKLLKAATAKFDKGFDQRKVHWSKILEFYKGNLYNTLVEWFHPRANKFKLMSAGDKLPKGREVWFDGPSVWIDSRVFVDDAR